MSIRIAPWSWWLFGLATLTGCHPSPGPAPAVPAAGSDQQIALTPAQVAQADVVTAVHADLPQWLQAPAQLQFDQNGAASVVSAYQGHVHSVLVDIGDRVKRGQVLLTIDSPDLAAAEQTLLSTRAARDLSAKTLQRTEQLRSIQTAALKDLEQARADSATAEANYHGAVRTLQSFGLSAGQIDQLRSANDLSASLPVPSPIDGIVTDRHITVGDLTGPSPDQAPLQVAPQNTRWAIAAVPEADAWQVQVGQPVQLQLDDQPDQLLSGQVLRVAQQSDPSSHTVAVRIGVSPSSRPIRSNMLASARILIATQSRATVVPADAVIREGDGSEVVFTTRDGRHFQRQPVQTGLRDPSWVQIRSGLQAGDRIANKSAIFIASALAQKSE